MLLFKMAALMRPICFFSHIRTKPLIFLPKRNIKKGMLRRKIVKVSRNTEKFDKNFCKPVIEKEDDPFLREPKSLDLPITPELIKTKEIGHYKTQHELKRKNLPHTETKVYHGVRCITVPKNQSLATSIFGQKISDARNKNQTHKEKVVLIEGYGQVVDALLAGATLKSLFFVQQETLKLLNLPAKVKNMDDIEVYKLQSSQMQIYTDVTVSKGVLGIFKMPEVGKAASMPSSALPVTVVLDNIQNPTSLGTLIRSISAVGCQQLIVLQGCEDIWHTEAVKAAGGGHFRVPLYTDVSWSDLQNYTNNEKNSVYFSISRKSLGQKLQKELSSKSIQRDSDTLSRTHDEDDEVIGYPKAPMKVKDYNEITYKGHITLIISDQVHNVSPVTRKFLFDNYGECLLLPMADTVKALDPMICGTVILYEINRQMTEGKHKIERIQQTDDTQET